MQVAPRAFALVLLVVAVLLVPGGGAARAEGPRCPYAVAHDAPLAAVESTIAEEVGFRHLRVEFNGVKGDRVPGWLYVPTKGAAAGARHPAVLLQYGSGGHKGTDYIVALGKQFVARGIVVFTIDSPGRGDRKEKKGANVQDWIVSDKGRDEFLHYCGDYSRAVDYLLARADVDPSRLAFVGISWGAITGVTYAAHDRRVKAVVSILGGGGPLGLADIVRGKREESVDPVRNVGLIAPRPLLLINATKDQVILRPFARALHRAAGKGAEKVWFETDHFFNGMDRAAAGETVIDFLLKRLPGAPL